MRISIHDRYDKIIEIVDKTGKSVRPKRKHQREKWVSENTDNLMLEQKETCRKFRNHRNDHIYLSWRQAATTVEESMVNDRNN